MADLLEDLFGIKPEDDKDEKDEATESTDEGAEEGTEDATESDASDDEDDVAAVSVESEDAADVESDADVKVESADDDAEDDEEKKPVADRSKIGLLKEIQKLRSQIALFQPEPGRAAQSQAPAPGQTTAPRAPQIPVHVKEDGTGVVVDQAALDAYVRQAAREMAMEANTPTPQQIRAMLLQEATQNFLAEAPNNKEIVQRASEIDEFVSLNIQQLIQNGYRITNVVDAVAALKHSGVDQVVMSSYPELRGIGFDDFVENMASASPAARRTTYRALAQASAPAPKARARKANGAQRELGRQPRSLTRKGGGRQTAATSDEREFKALEAEFQANAFDLKAFPDSKYKKLASLGKKLGIEGFD